MSRTITLVLPADLDAILVDKATGNDTPETLAARIVAEWCQPYADAAATAKLEAMAANNDLMRVGLKALEATPEKRAAMIAAADAALASAPSR